MARPHRRRDPIPTMEQIHAGLDAVEASASPERLLDMWLDREEPREAWEHAVVLEEPPDDRPHADVLRHAWHARPQAADAAHN